VNDDDLRKLLNHPAGIIAHYESKRRKIIFYLDSIPGIEKPQFCFSFRINQRFVVKNLQPALVKVYEYYKAGKNFCNLPSQYELHLTTESFESLR